MATTTRSQIQIKAFDVRGLTKTIRWQDRNEVDARDFDVVGDGVADDTSSIQAALDFAYANKIPCYLPGGTYKITSQLNLYQTGNNNEDGAVFYGAGVFKTAINYYGPTNLGAIRIIGSNVTVADLGITNHSAGWLSAIEYDGIAPGRSTHGTIRNVFIDGNFQPGDGIALGRSGVQADMLKIDHCYFQNLTYGSAVVSLNGNALTCTMIAPTVGRCHIGVQVGVTNNFMVCGGEFDDNDINFVHNLGGPLVVTGVRSEGSKRAYWNNASGSGSCPVSLIGYWQASANNARLATTGAIQNGQTALTLSKLSFISGDKIDIAGAGPAGGVLSTTINAMTTITPTLVIVQVANAASTTVAAGNVTLTAGVIQPLLTELGAGPYNHIDCVFSDPNVYAAAVANGPQTFIGCRWENVDITDPYGSVVGAQVFQVGSLTVSGCTSNANSHKMRAMLAENPITTLTANSGTPSVADNTQFITANTNPTTITDFHDGFNGQRIFVLVNDTNTSIGGGSVKTSTGAAVATQNGRVYTFIRQASFWYSTGL